MQHTDKFFSHTAQFSAANGCENCQLVVAVMWNEIVQFCAK